MGYKLPTQVTLWRYPMIPALATISTTFESINQTNLLGVDPVTTFNVSVIGGRKQQVQFSRTTTGLW